MFLSEERNKQLLSKLIGISAAALLAIVLVALFPAGSVLAKSEEKPKFEFGLVPDAQYCECEDNGTRYYQDSVTKLIEAAQTFNQQNIDFTIQTGDLIDRNIASFSTMLPIYNMIEGPKYHVLGNHDFPVTTDEVVDILDMPNQYYDFKYKNWRFVILDTNDLSFYANPEGSQKYEQAESMYNSLKEDGAVNAQTWNGGVSNEQMVWLREVLNKAEKTNEKVVVIGHMPVYPKNNHNVWNDEEIVKELEEADSVVAYFNGHNHAGNYAVKDGIHYVNLKGMVETSDTNSFSIVEVYKNRLEIDGYGREGDRVLEIKE